MAATKSDAMDTTENGVTHMNGDVSKKTNGEHARTQIEPRSGYTWEREEDAPGYGWKSKRAQEEALRAKDAVVDPDKRLGRKYGDPCLIIGEDEPWEKVLDFAHYQEAQAGTSDKKE